MNGTTDGSVSSILQAAASLNDAQRAELLQFVEWMRFRDG
jgi:hypothetical protein